MDIEAFFPVWDKLTADEQARLRQAAVRRDVPKGTILHDGSADCVGLLAVCSGQLRAFIRSREGKELTLYRLFERDICLFSASCLMQSIQFEVTIEAETDAALFVIPAEVYKKEMESSAALAGFTNQLMASRFSEVMWLIEQVMWKSFDARLAQFLLEESAAEGTAVLSITHERIAAHMGSAREVVTRMLRYFHSEGMVTLARGTIALTDVSRLRELADS